MTDRIKEQLSAFLDGELPEAETSLLLKRLERDDDLRGALSRYSLIGAVLRDEDDVPAARQVAARVSAAISREPDIGGAGLPGLATGWRRPLAGLGIAAGVASLALLVTQPLRVASHEPGATPAVAAVAPAPEPMLAIADPAPVIAEPASTGYTTPPAAPAPRALAQAQLANYLVAHSGFASPLTQRSLVTGLLVAPEPELPVEDGPR